MEKISHIIPPSARQVWVSGEIDKPRRIADPVPGESMGIPRPHAETPSREPMEEASGFVEGSLHKGTRLNTMA